MLREEKGTMRGAGVLLTPACWCLTSAPRATGVVKGPQKKLSKSLADDHNHFVMLWLALIFQFFDVA